eukprot:SM000006S19417  [mRNA]  locus=s6:610254:612176:+ [translate_table: standard]
MADALLHAGAGLDALAQPAAAPGGAVVTGLLRALQRAARRGGGKWATPLAVNGLVFVARPYEHARDREPLADLCRDNYGGQDELPELIARDLDVYDTARICLERPGSPLLAFGAVRQDGQREFAWIYGLRIDDNSRRQGLGTFLMRCLASSAVAAKTEFVLTATYVDNQAAKRMFFRLGYAFIGGCHLWPRSDVVARIKALDAADVAGTQSCSMLAAAGVPWLETSEPARILADQWVQCERLDVLEGAVAACRACWSGPQGHNTKKEGLSRPSRTCGAPVELATAEGSEQSELSRLLALPWFPMFFEAWPLRGRLVAEALADRRAWVLSSHSGHQTSEGPETKSCGVLLMQRTPARLVVGVLASSSDVVAAALVFASRGEHRFRVVFDLRDADWLDPQMGLPAKTSGGSLRQDLAELFAGEVEGTDRKVLIYGRSLNQDNVSPRL